MVYTTRRGDTLVSVADRFGVSLSQLRRWNKLPATGIKVEAGHRLHVAEPARIYRTSSKHRRGSSSSGTGHSREIASASAPSHQAASVKGGPQLSFIQIGTLRNQHRLEEFFWKGIALVVRKAEISSKFFVTEEKLVCVAMPLLVF